MPAFDDVVALLDEGYQQTENGYGTMRDGGFGVSVRTDMPGVTPRCGIGGSAGTAAIRAATSCGIRVRTWRPAGPTAAEMAVMVTSTT